MPTWFVGGYLAFGNELLIERPAQNLRRGMHRTLARYTNVTLLCSDLWDATICTIPEDPLTDQRQENTEAKGKLNPTQISFQ